MESPSPEEPEKSKSSPKQYLWLLVVFLLTVVSQLATFYLIPDGQFNDDAAYVLRALQFAQPEQWGWSRDVSDFRPGWPLVMAGPLVLSGEDLRVARVINILFTATDTCLIALLMWQLSGSRLLGAGLAWLFSQSPRMLQLGSSIMSEPFYFFLALVLLGFGLHRRWEWRGSLLLGILTGWCVGSRPDGLSVGIALGLALLLDKERRKSMVALWGVTAVAFFLWLRAAFPDSDAHLLHAAEAGNISHFSFSYIWLYLTNNALNSADALLGWRHEWMRYWWFALILILAYLCIRHRDRLSPLKLAGNAWLMWALAHMSALYLWPYSSSRYWVLWSTLAIGFLLWQLPRKAAYGLLALLLALQAPQTVREYRNGPVASRFQKQKYLPFYRAFSDHGTVTTLQSARVELLGRTPTIRLWNSAEFSNIPLAMASNNSKFIEWENSSRIIVSYSGTKPRLYPNHPVRWLQASSLFAVHHDCGFSTCYELVEDQQKLQRAGQYVMMARQLAEPEERLEALEQALVEVEDLPEIRVWRDRLKLELDPESEVAVDDLIKVYRQYPHDYELGVWVLAVLKERGRQELADELARLALKTLRERAPGFDPRAFEPYLLKSAGNSRKSEQ